jgi:hypothetical protein
MSRTDSLGQVYTLTGFQAYCSVNNTLAAGGDTLLSDAPALETPTGLATMTVTSAGGGSPALSVAYTPTPSGAGNRIFIRFSPQRSSGRSFEGDYRLLVVTAANAASPSNALSAYQARFGTPVTGRRIFVSATVVTSGFESVPFASSVVVS